MCVLGNIAVVDHNKTPSLRPGPTHSKEVAGVCGDIPEGSPGWSGACYWAASTTRVSKPAVAGGVEELCKMNFLLFPTIFFSNYSKSLLQHSIALICPTSLNASSPSLLSHACRWGHLSREFKINIDLASLIFWGSSGACWKHLAPLWEGLHCHSAHTDITYSVCHL